MKLPSVRHYPFSWLVIAIIWFLCFMTPPSTPVDDVPGIDKLVHTVMYAGLCCTIWWEYFRRRDPRFSWRRFFPHWVHTPVAWNVTFLWAFAAPIIMSGIIELGQAYCSGGRRSGDWWDFAANSLGVVVIYAIVVSFHRSNKAVQ